MLKILKAPEALVTRGLAKAWPKLVLVSGNSKPPTDGTPFIMVRNEEDESLAIRLILPMLIKKMPFFNWREVYKNVFHREYSPIRICFAEEVKGRTGSTYGAPSEPDIDVTETTLEELMDSDNTWIDMDIVHELGIMPKFCEDIYEAIRSDITNSFIWNDGYNKKTGLCVGSLEYNKLPRTLIIIDVSGSMPNGISGGLLAMVGTMSSITNADIIITGSKSVFIKNEDAVNADPRKLRREIGRSNESHEFIKIFETHDMGYDNVISFGDSDNPGCEWIDDIPGVNPKILYDFFVSRTDTYGVSSKQGTGYARWCKRANPGLTVKTYDNWAHCFNWN